MMTVRMTVLIALLALNAVLLFLTVREYLFHTRVCRMLGEEDGNEKNEEA